MRKTRHTEEDSTDIRDSGVGRHLATNDPDLDASSAEPGE
jgi:hypothetical protein